MEKSTHNILQLKNKLKTRREKKTFKNYIRVKKQRVENDNDFFEFEFFFAVS